MMVSDENQESSAVPGRANRTRREDAPQTGSDPPEDDPAATAPSRPARDSRDDRREPAETAAEAESTTTPRRPPQFTAAQLVSPIALSVFYVGLGLWLWYFTDQWLLGGVIVALVSTLIGYVSKLLTKEEHEALQAWIRRQLFDSAALRWLSVGLCVLAVLLGSFVGGFQFEAAAELKEYRLGPPSAEGVKIPHPEKHKRVLRWIPGSLFVPRPFEVTADGHPVRRVLLRPWQRHDIDSNYLWREPVLLLLPSRDVFRRTVNNPARLTLSIDGVKDRTVSGYRGEALWVGPIRDGRVSTEIITRWIDAGYSEQLIEDVWRQPQVREELKQPLPEAARVRLSMHWEHTGSDMQVVLSSPEEKIGDGQFHKNYPQWKVINVP